jgi:Domain of unknown function (DUF4333)
MAQENVKPQSDPRKENMTRYRVLPLVGVALALGFAGCGGGGETTVHSNELEGQIADDVHETTGVTMESVVCPEPITQTAVGTTFECEATTTEGRPYTVTLKNAPNGNSTIVKIKKGDR